jgi:hypothetical protein
MNTIILLIFSFIGLIIIGIGIYLKMMDPEVILTNGHLDNITLNNTDDSEKFEIVWLYSYQPAGLGAPIKGTYNWSKINNKTYNIQGVGAFRNAMLSKDGPHRAIKIYYMKKEVMTHSVEVPIPGTENPYTKILLISGGVFIFIGILIAIIVGGKKNKTAMDNIEPFSVYNY